MKPWFSCSGRGYESPHWGTLRSSGLVASSTTTEPSKLVDLSCTFALSWFGAHNRLALYGPHFSLKRQGRFRVKWGPVDCSLEATTCISKPGQGERLAYKTLVFV